MIKTGKQLAEACKDIAENYKTLYVMGCFGAPMTPANKKRYMSNHTYNKQSTRRLKIYAATKKTFGFDCVCLIKGLLWGWAGDTSETYGGAIYCKDGIPDIGADQMITVCKDVSEDFRKIEIGEAVWMPGHIGVYIGGGLVVESTPIWKDGVQITAVHNIGKISGYHGRTWKKHGKIPYVEYSAESVENPEPEPAKKRVEALAREITNGEWGVNPERKKKITAKYGAEMYEAAQIVVNAMYEKLKDNKSVYDLAVEIKLGEWGVNPERREQITAKYGAEVYEAAQKCVNMLLK